MKSSGVDTWSCSETSFTEANLARTEANITRTEENVARTEENLRSLIGVVDRYLREGRNGK